MKSARWLGFAAALGWFLFPLVPALLGSTYHQTIGPGLYNPKVADPRDWGWSRWILLTGPLLGYGFLAGATLALPDESNRRGPKGWLSRRSAWVAIGPWVGFLALAAVYQTILLVGWAYPPSQGWSGPSLPPSWQGTWKAWLILQMLIILGIGTLGYGWLPIAWAALRRARRIERLRQSLARGLALAVGFVGSLFGSFWAITELWRGYFFDPRIMPALIAASTLGWLAGCAAPETYGEVRRRELFQAMLLAWLLGLALAWRWWSRPRSKPPGPSS